MELKNALSICLIAMFSATLVVLIARSLDLQTGSRIEPQLVRIAEQLEALRAAGGIATRPGADTTTHAVAHGLVVYYFHGNTRCPTCRAIETLAHDTIHSRYAAQLATGQMVWRTVNYEEAAGKELTKQFEVQMPVVVLAQMRDGQIATWERLDTVWALVGKPPEFTAYINQQVDQLLGMAPESPAAAETSEIPLPVDNSDIPLPE